MTKVTSPGRTCTQQSWLPERIWSSLLMPDNLRNRSVAAAWPGSSTAEVVQRIPMTDTSEPASSHLHHIIPMASRQSFFNLDPCGTTQYGRLQFQWVRGHDEDEQLSVSGVKIQDTAYKDGSVPP
ncbi:hypothetical protein ABVT39_002041 [Epinephelus coioides]